MKVIRNGSYVTERVYESIEDYTEAELDSSQFANGLVEAAASTAANNSRAIGRLVDCLYGKGILTADEVLEVVEGALIGNIEIQ